MKRSRIDLRIRTDEKADWDKGARELGLTISELIRRATNQFLDSFKNPAKKR